MRGARVWWMVFAGLFGLTLGVWLLFPDPPVKLPTKAADKLLTAPDGKASPPHRILFVNSYHHGYPWSDGILAEFIRVLELIPLADTEGWADGDLLLRAFYMDTKRRPAEASILEAARRARRIIDDWKPDILVTSDDNAVKYLVVPLLKSRSLPVVFTGINWDAGEYDLPRDLFTGIIEVQPIDELLEALRPWARGSTICFLKGEDYSAVKEADAFERFLGIALQRHLVNNFDQWLTAYRQIQRDCDMLLVGNPASVEGWNGPRAKQLVETATRIPTGTWDAWMKEYALLTFSTVPAEQGAWAAGAVRDILGGRSPADIPLARNHKAKIYRNMTLAKQLGIVFPMEFIRKSWAVEGHPGR